MSTPESLDDVIEQIADDPRIVGYFRHVIQMGLSEINLDFEREITQEMMNVYGVDRNAIVDVSTIAIGRVDQDILDGKISLLQD